MNFRSGYRLLIKINELLDKKNSLRKYIFLGIGLAAIDLFCLFLLGKLFSSIIVTSDTIINQKIPTLTFKQLASILLIAYVLRLVIGVRYISGINNLSAKVEVDLKCKLLIYYQSLNYEARTKRGFGEIAQSVNLWTASFSRAVVAPFAKFICESVVTFVTLCYFAYLFPLAIITIFLFSVLVVWGYDNSVKQRFDKLANEHRRISVEVADEIQDYFIGYKEIYALNLGIFFIEKIRAQSTRMCASLAKAVTLSQSPRLFVEAIIIISTIVLLWILIVIGSNPIEKIPNFAIVLAGLVRVASWFSLSATTLSNLRMYRPIVDSLHADIVMNIENSSVDLHRKDQSKKIKKISLEEVVVGYGGKRNVLSSLSYTIFTGDKIAIVGPSGSGKTTLFDTLLGMIKPYSGQVTVLFDDGSSANSLVGSVSYISQNTFILNDSLKRNVALGFLDDDIDEKKVIECLIRAQLPEFANSEGLAFNLGSSGIKVSGGQKQRIAIARALYSGKSILLLDEATSGLDENTESNLADMLLNLGKDVTLMLITHNQAVARKFDRILKIKKS